jgi:hypothetical protein
MSALWDDIKEFWLFSDMNQLSLYFIYIYMLGNGVFLENLVQRVLNCYTRPFTFYLREVGNVRVRSPSGWSSHLKPCMQPVCSVAKIMVSTWCLTRE